MTGFTITDPVVLPVDVELVPIDSLPDELRSQVDHVPGDVAVTRPLSRTPSAVVDSATADLLESFRTPTRIIDAVIGYSAPRALDATETLESAFGVLQQFINQGLLVAAGSGLEEAIVATFEPGSRLGPLEVVEPRHTIVDTEVYRCRTTEGQEAAVKIARRGFEAPLARLFAHEAAVLELLDGRVSPTPIAQGFHDERPYLAMSWREGRDVYEASAEARLLDDRATLLRLAASVLGAYRQLHEQGVVHGDVHPRNVIVDEDGDVSLIDFGLARSMQPGLLAEPPRGGIDFFREPEFASGPASYAGEQYAVAALLYLLLTGGHTHHFSLEEAEMLRQLTETPPLPFSEWAVEGLGAVEQVLARALAKTPEERYPDLRAFQAEFVAAIAKADPAAPRTNQLETLLDDVVERLGLAGPMLPSALEAPTASLQNGAAGYAYGLLRIACAREDEDLLALADVWSVRATRELSSGDAFVNEALEITQEQFGTKSFYHCESGVHWADASIARARWDDPAANAAIAAFISSTSGAYEFDDLAFGPAGALVGSSLLLESSSSDALRQRGRELQDDVATRINALPPIDRCEELSSLGIAHGWGGLLYAVLLWAQSSGDEPPPDVQERLAQLEALARPSGRGLVWPRAVGATLDGLAHTWCNGAAGLAHLWALAYMSYGDEAYARLAERAALAAVDGPDAMGDLCCGLAGRAYAALALYQVTGDETWLEHASSLAQRAAARIRSYALRRDSLYKGDIGVAVLAADLRVPDEAAMPAFARAHFMRES